jgi:hypothetical protein
MIFSLCPKDTCQHADMSPTCRRHVGMSSTTRHLLYVQKSLPTCRLTSPRHDMSRRLRGPDDIIWRHVGPTLPTFTRHVSMSADDMSFGGVRRHDATPTFPTKDSIQIPCLATSNQAHKDEVRDKERGETWFKELFSKLLKTNGKIEMSIISPLPPAPVFYTHV